MALEIARVEWESVAAHEDFRASEAFPQWRAHVSPHFESRPDVEHFEDVDGARPRTIR
jgi:quinol monooxygenase YgiN